MKKNIALLLLLLQFNCGKKAERPAEPADDFAERHLMLLGQYAGCATAAPDKLWCRAMDSKVAAGGSAPATGTYMGVTTFVQTAGGSADSLTKFSRLSSLAVRESSGNTYALIATINPRNAPGKAEVARLLPLVKRQIEGAAEPQVAEPGLRAYLESLPARASYPLRAHRRGFLIDGGSRAELRPAGKVWISVEVPANNPAGIWITIFPAY